MKTYPPMKKIASGERPTRDVCQKLYGHRKVSISEVTLECGHRTAINLTQYQSGKAGCVHCPEVDR